MGDVQGFDLATRKVLFTDGECPYDTLVVAAGARHSYFGHAEWERVAPGLKTVEDATEIRRRVLSAFEEAERTDDLVERREWLTFVIVGAGPTGVELAGAIAEIATHSLKHDFREIIPSDARVVLVEAGPRVLAAFPEDLSAKAQASLERLGVQVRTSTKVEAINERCVTLQSTGGGETLATRTALWGAGVQASPLAKLLGEATGAEVDRAGRVTVAPDLTLPGHPEIFVVGDMALSRDPAGKQLPGVAPVAMQQGQFVAKRIRERLRDRQTDAPFRYFNKGNLATIGKSAAVAELGKLKFSGFWAWVLWLFVHLMYIVSFRNRLLVLTQWSWSYFTYDRSARLITGEAKREGKMTNEQAEMTNG